MFVFQCWTGPQHRWNRYRADSASEVLVSLTVPQACVFKSWSVVLVSSVRASSTSLPHSWSLRIIRMLSRCEWRECKFVLCLKWELKTLMQIWWEKEKKKKREIKIDHLRNTSVQNEWTRLNKAETHSLTCTGGVFYLNVLFAYAWIKIVTCSLHSFFLYIKSKKFSRRCIKWSIECYRVVQVIQVMFYWLPIRALVDYCKINKYRIYTYLLTFIMLQKFKMNTVLLNLLIIWIIIKIIIITYHGFHQNVKWHNCFQHW